MLHHCKSTLSFFVLMSDKDIQIRQQINKTSILWIKFYKIYRTKKQVFNAFSFMKSKANDSNSVVISKIMRVMNDKNVYCLTGIAFSTVACFLHCIHPGNASFYCITLCKKIWNNTWECTRFKPACYDFFGECWYFCL